MFFRFAKFTFTMFLLLGIARTATTAKDLLAQGGLIDPQVNFPNSTTIFPMQGEIVAAASRLFTMAISMQAIFFLACLSVAIWLGGLGFTRLVKVYEDRNSGWPEQF